MEPTHTHLSATHQEFPSRLKYLVAGLFIFSGLTSLVYETLWIRILSLGVGSTSASISIVLSIFFFGLSVGSYIAGKNIHRIKDPFRFYGYLEGGIGLYSLLVIFPLLNFHELLAILPLTGSWSWFGIFVKFFAVFVLLIAPTIAMGCTLPLLLRIFSDSKASLGRLISVLYAVNTIGAALGAFFTAFFFIPQFGVFWANIVAVIGNLLILATVLIAAKRFGHLLIPTPMAGPNDSRPRWSDIDPKNPTPSPALLHKIRKNLSSPFASLSRQQKLILLSTGLTGYVSISFEVIWNKYLGVFFGTNIYGLGLILAMYLFGIALGSFLLSFVIEKIQDLARFYVRLLLASVAMSLLASYLLNLAPLAVNVAGYYLAESFTLLSIKTWITAFILFFPTCIFGALFPLAMRLITEDKKQASSLVGSAYAINTIGSILGSFMTGLIWIPLVGSANAIRMGEIILLLLVSMMGAALLLQNRRWITTTSIAFALLVIFGSNISFKNIIKSAYHQYADTQLSFKDVMKYFSREHEEFKLIVEGETGIISLSHDQQDGENYRNYLRLKTNGLNESIYDLQRLDILPKYEGLLGFLPYMFTQNPTQAFVVGYGGGYTVDFLTSANIRRVHVAELEAGIIEAAQNVYNGDNPILKRNNLNLKIEDARFVLAAKLYGPYDIIVSQPSHSWLTGVANLFTQEYFEIVKSNLKPGGVFSQWLNLYNMDATVLRSILHTFYQVFPHGAIFTNRGDQEMIMLGSQKPLEVRLRRLEQRLKSEFIQEKLMNIPVTSPAHILSSFSMGRSDVVKLTEAAQVNTDLNAFAEVRQTSLFYRLLDEKSHPEIYLSEHYKGDFSDILAEPTRSSAEFYYQILLAMIDTRKFDKFAAIMEKYEEKFGTDLQELERLGYLSLQVQRYVSARNYLQKIMSHQPNTARLNWLLSALIELGENQEVLLNLEKFKHHGDKISQCYQAEALLQLDQSKSSTLFSQMSKNFESYKEACGYYINKVLGHYFIKQGKSKEALPYLEDYYSQYPDDVVNLENLTAAYLLEGDRKNSREFTAFFETAVQNEINQLKSLSDSYEQRGLEEDALVIRKRIRNLEVRS